MRRRTCFLKARGYKRVAIARSLIFETHLAAAIKRSSNRLRKRQRSAVERVRPPRVTEHVRNRDRRFPGGCEFGPVHADWIVKLQQT
jgi:hypothetical protein